VQRLNTQFWIARRLGGSSTGLPDIVAVNNKEAIFLSIEAKSGTGDALYVPPDQILRCLLIRDMFRYYRKRHAIIAFKFLRKKRTVHNGLVTYEKRKLIEYYKVVDTFKRSDSIPAVKCTYDGRIFVVADGHLSPKRLPDYLMPFHYRIRDNTFC
jgi:Holliday junction resolvase